MIYTKLRKLFISFNLELYTWKKENAFQIQSNSNLQNRFMLRSKITEHNVRTAVTHYDLLYQSCLETEKSKHSYPAMLTAQPLHL